MLPKWLTAMLVLLHEACPNAASSPTRGRTFNSAYSSNVSPIRSIIFSLPTSYRGHHAPL